MTLERFLTAKTEWEEQEIGWTESLCSLLLPWEGRVKAGVPLKSISGVIRVEMAPVLLHSSLWWIHTCAVLTLRQEPREETVKAKHCSRSAFWHIEYSTQVKMCALDLSPLYFLINNKTFLLSGDKWYTMERKCNLSIWPGSSFCFYFCALAANML